MMRQEASWVGGALASLAADEIGPMLSVGSGNADFRSRRQGWIDEQIFGPLERRSVTVLHHELHPGDGIDLAGDLTDPAVHRQLADIGVKSILCCNVLEHVPSPAELAAGLTDALPSGGWLVVTVPRWFPYHPDPLDTMFRPGPGELRSLFPQLEVHREQGVRCDSLLRYWLRTPAKLTSIRNGLAARRAAGANDRPAEEIATPSVPLRDTLTMALVRTEVSCVVLRKP